MIRGILTLALTVLAAAAASTAAADTVVDRELTATRAADGTVTASITVMNTGPDAVTFRPAATPTRAGCLLTADPTSAAAGQSTTVKVTLPQACFPDADTPVAVDLDGGGARGAALTATVISPPADEPSDWTPMWWGLFVGALLAGTVALRGWTEHDETRAAIVGSRGSRKKRTKAYEAVQTVVQERLDSLSGAHLNWRRLKKPVYDLTSPIGNLEAGWSFKDSWVANLTVASTALIALLTSTDGLTAVLGEKPAGALGVMTVTGLVSAALVGVANTVVKLVGPSVSVVTVAGLIASTALVVLAAQLQVVTVALCVVGVAGHWALAVAVLVLAVVVAAVLEVYAFRSVGQAIRGGFADHLPVVPADAVSVWAATDGWEKQVVEAQIRATYADWLQKDTSRPTKGSVPGMAHWAPVTAPPAAEPQRRSLL